MGVLLCLGVYCCIGAVRLELGGNRMHVGARSAETKSVCCAVRTGSLNTAVCASSLKG